MVDAIIWIQPKKHWILMIDLNLLKDLYKINSYSGEEEKNSPVSIILFKETLYWIKNSS